MAHKRRITAEEYQQVSNAFALFFPNCFVFPGTTKRPLKIGIKMDVLTEARAKFPDLSGRQIRGFLARYTSDRSYFLCVRQGCTRVDLQGNFTGFVSEREARFASTELDRLISGSKKRKSTDRRGPDDGPISVGRAAVQAIEAKADAAVPPRRLPWAKALDPEMNTAPWPTPVPEPRKPETLEEKLQRLVEAQFAASMSDDWYYSNGRKAKDDAEIALVKQQIRLAGRADA